MIPEAPCGALRGEMVGRHARGAGAVLQRDEMGLIGRLAFVDDIVCERPAAYSAGDYPRLDASDARYPCRGRCRPGQPTPPLGCADQILGQLCGHPEAELALEFPRAGATHPQVGSRSTYVQHGDRSNHPPDQLSDDTKDVVGSSLRSLSGHTVSWRYSDESSATADLC
jgi:hypothetical protein